MPYVNVRALHLLKLNINRVMAQRKLRPSDLARKLGTDPSTVSKMLNPELNLNIQIEWLDKFQNALGIEPYQLFSPGMGGNELTERRSNKERRSQVDRRADWPIMSTRSGPQTKEALSPRLLELVELGELLNGKYYDHWLRVGKATRLRQEIEQPSTHPADHVPIVEKPPAQSASRKRKRKNG